LAPAAARARAAKRAVAFAASGGGGDGNFFGEEGEEEEEEEEDAALVAAAEAEEDAAWAPFLVTTGALADMAGHDGYLSPRQLCRVPAVPSPPFLLQSTNRSLDLF
jgi:hypothetical protein